MKRPVSKYAAVWDKLKKTRSCELIADRQFHRCIIKAVSRRKELDLAYQLLLSEAKIRERINTSVEGNKITFVLIKTMNDLDIGDL